jgi:4-hydroxy-3-methylbut-2-enyl diphosphate reductase
VKVVECERGFGDRNNKNKLIFSRKAALIEDQKKSKDSTWDVLEVGQIRKGTVKRITDFGAFVDIGGVDGLLHVSEMAWHRIKHPSEIVKDGDEIEVFVLSLDKETHKVSLSLRKVQANPWDTVATKYAPGTVVSVKVLRLTNFGAFVELEPGVEGLVHISQLSDRRIAKAQDAVSLGQIVDAKIISVDLETKRISLSIRELIEGAGTTFEPVLAEESPVEAAPAEQIPDETTDLPSEE